MPGVVGPAIGVREFDVFRGEGQYADGGEQHAAVHAPVVEQLCPRVRLEAGGFAAVDVFQTAGEQLHAVDVRTAEAGQHALQHHLFADDEFLDAVLFLDADGPVPVLWFQVALPEVRRLHHVRIAVDDRH